MLQAWVKRLTWEELRSGLALLAMTFILLPLLANRTADPWESLNPHAIWLMTLLIAALSFVGSVAIKVTGKNRGILLTGIAGGLVSSTALALSLARLARDSPGRARLPVTGMLAASVTMIGRVLVIVGFSIVVTLQRILNPLVAAAVVLILGTFALMRNTQQQSDGKNAIDLRNPFDLPTVLKLCALLTAILFAACRSDCRSCSPVGPPVSRCAPGWGPGPQLALSRILIILDWVASWKPIETFRYDWWPLKRRRAHYHRLRDAAAEVRAH